MWGQYYNIQIDERQTVKENIIRLISGTFSGLKDFVETYLKTELRRINNADIVFDTFANGAFHYSDILSKSQIETSTTLNNIIQNLVLENRNKLSISGVKDVLSFDDQVVIMETELGLLTIKGENLKINKLSIDTQEVIVEGEINNLGYSDHSKKEQDGGLFSKIFK